MGTITIDYGDMGEEIAKAYGCENTEDAIEGALLLDIKGRITTRKTREDLQIEVVRIESEIQESLSVIKVAKKEVV